MRNASSAIQPSTNAFTFKLEYVHLCQSIGKVLYVPGNSAEKETDRPRCAAASEFETKPGMHSRISAFGCFAVSVAFAAARSNKRDFARQFRTDGRGRA